MLYLLYALIYVKLYYHILNYIKYIINLKLYYKILYIIKYVDN